MISASIFKILSQDETDITQAAALTQLKLNNPDLVLSDLCDYHYKSLKTILKENSNNDVDIYNNPNWAEKHIKVHRKNYQFENIDLKREDRPFIVISVINTSLINFSGSRVAFIYIDIYTDSQKDDTSLVWNINERIKSRFLYNPAGSCSRVRIFEKNIPGLLNIQFDSEGESEIVNDYIRSKYNVRYKVLHAIND